MKPIKYLLSAGVAIGAVALTSVVAQSPFEHARSPRQRTHNPPIVHRQPTDFGDPLANLTDAQLAAFTEGLEEFEGEDTPESGLGPTFNNNSCVACHSVPASGGSSTTTVTRFGRSTRGHFDPLENKGGSLLQQFAIDPGVQETIPAEANVVSHRQTTPLFGAGLVEAIEDATIMANAARAKPDGISGRVSMIEETPGAALRVGRFGWKAQHADLLVFAADAYVNEMGITNRIFPTENAPNGDTARLALYDKVVDPEDPINPATGKADIDLFADFMRLLGPPPVGPLTPSAIAGGIVFARTGCHHCHQAVMVTGSNAVAALDHKLVPLFSDLLLHDMGSLGDGIVQNTAGENEFKTAPLWGLRMRTAFLHDGRAATVDDAIRMHDGEAGRARDRYLRLSPAETQHLLDFLGAI